MSPPDGRSRPLGKDGPRDLTHEVPVSVPKGTDEKPQRRKRLSADLPQNWLHDPAWWGLSGDAWRLHTHALMWCIGRTDGEIPDFMLMILLPDPLGVADAAAELVDAGHWERTEAGWRVLFWEDSQSTVEQIENRRKYERRKKDRRRTGESTVDNRRESPSDNRGESPADVPAVVPRGKSPGDYGTARNGKDAPRGTTTTRARTRAKTTDDDLFNERSDVAEWRAAR